jgi:hypothetical protein
MLRMDPLATYTLLVELDLSSSKPIPAISVKTLSSCSVLVTDVVFCLKTMAPSLIKTGINSDGRLAAVCLPGVRKAALLRLYQLV